MGSQVRVSVSISGQGICVEHQTYLGFSWLFNVVPRYFTFVVLPFGLSSAFFCFTKLLRPLVKRWRSMSHGSFVYLDDGFISQPDQCSAAAAAVIQKESLSLRVFSLNSLQGEWTTNVSTLHYYFRLCGMKTDVSM